MKKSRILMLAAVVAAVSLSAGALSVAVGGDEKKDAPNVEAPKAVVAANVETKTGPAVAAAKDAGLSGVVKIKGDVPRAKKIKMDADPKCAALHADDTPMSEEVVADKEGNVRWAFVYVKKGAPAAKPGDLKPVVIDQKGCHYEPHVLGILVGQELVIRNSDALLHNIHALPFNNKEFNEGQPQQGMEAKKVFTTPEVSPSPIKVKCDIHAWMGAWIAVMEHPFFAVTDAAGKFEIKGLPDGHYTIEVWHEKYKTVSAEVDVKGATTSNFELTDKKE